MSEQKTNIIAALDKWLRQRPGLEFGNYGDRQSYAAELRSITKDLHQARVLLRHVERSSITAEQLTAAFKRGFSGRLSWDGKKLDYTVGQYWPTEYRRAVCSVLAAAIWDYWRDGMTGENIGDRLRASARNTFGRAIAARWFN